MRFFALGECMVELAPSGCGDNYAAAFAGDTFNTLWYLKQLAGPEARAAYISAFGDDVMSGKMAAFMEQAGIDTSLCARLKGATAGLYMIHLDKGERSFSYWRGQSAARQTFRHLPAVDALGGKGALLHFSGISLAVTPAEGRALLIAFLADARRSGVEIAFDPNMRPRLWDSAGEMRHWIDEGASVADIVLPSFDEEQAAFPGSTIETVARRYRGLGARCAVVKNAGNPGFMSCEDAGEAFFQPLTGIVAVDTTAAGDAFNAGFLHARARGRTLPESAHAGAALSARVITRPGALVPLTQDASGD